MGELSWYSCVSGVLLVNESQSDMCGWQQDRVRYRRSHTESNARLPHCCCRCCWWWQPVSESLACVWGLYRSTERHADMSRSRRPTTQTRQTDSPLEAAWCNWRQDRVIDLGTRPHTVQCSNHTTSMSSTNIAGPTIVKLSLTTTLTPFDLQSGRITLHWRWTIARDGAPCIRSQTDCQLLRVRRVGNCMTLMKYRTSWLLFRLHPLEWKTTFADSDTIISF